MCRMCLVEVEGPRGSALQVSCMLDVGRGDGRPHRVAGGEEGAGRRPRVPADQPPARLPGVRQGRRVPAAGPDDGVRPGREPVRRGEAPLREADPDQRPRLPRPRAVHPVRSLHPVRERGRRRSADQLHRPRQRDAGAHVPRRAVRVVLQRQHRADLPGRRADREAVPLQGPPVGPRAGRVDVHDVLGRLPRHRAVVAEPSAALPGRRHRPGELGLALRQGSLRVRGDRERAAPVRAARPRGRRARRGVVGARARAGRDARSATRSSPRRAGVGRGDRRSAAHQRGLLRVGEAREGRHRHRQRRRAARRRSRRRARRRSARRDDRRGVRGRHAARARPRPQGRAAGPLPAGPRRGREARPAGRRAVTDRHVADAARGGVAAVPAGRAGRARRRHSCPAAPPPEGIGADWFAAGTDLVVLVGRPSVAESSSPTEAAVAAIAAARPDARFLVATRRGNVRGAIDMGLAPGLLAGPGRARRGTRLVHRALGSGARRPGPRHDGHPSRRRRRAHRLPGPARRRPALRLPRSPTRRAGAREREAGDRGRHVPHRLARSARRWCSRPPATRRSPAPRRTSKVG